MNGNHHMSRRTHIILDLLDKYHAMSSRVPQTKLDIEYVLMCL